MYGMKKNGMKNGMKKKGVAKKHKGFSKLPENVQEKIDKDLAAKYGSGGKVYTNKNDEDTVEDMKDME